MRKATLLSTLLFILSLILYAGCAGESFYSLKKNPSFESDSNLEQRVSAYINFKFSTEVDDKIDGSRLVLEVFGPESVGPFYTNLVKNTNIEARNITLWPGHYIFKARIEKNNANLFVSNEVVQDIVKTGTNEVTLVLVEVLTGNAVLDNPNNAFNFTMSFDESLQYNNTINLSVSVTPNNATDQIECLNWFLLPAGVETVIKKSPDNSCFAQASMPIADEYRVCAEIERNNDVSMHCEAVHFTGDVLTKFQLKRAPMLNVSSIDQTAVAGSATKITFRINDNNTDYPKTPCDETGQNNFFVYYKDSAGLFNALNSPSFEKVKDLSNDCILSINPIDPLNITYSLNNRTVFALRIIYQSYRNLGLYDVYDSVVYLSK